jgi:hypothetical protein
MMIDARAITIAIGVSTVSALGGCIVYATPYPRVPANARIIASNDFNCPYDAVDVANVGGDEYVAFGCGRRETFACTQTMSDGELRCERVVGRFDDDLPLATRYGAPAPTCYAACSASSSATCMAACNGNPQPAPP